MTRSLLAGTIVLTLMACNNSGSTLPTEVSVEATTANVFNPSSVTLKQGGSVSFTNKASLFAHNVVFMTVPAGVDKNSLKIDYSDFKTDQPVKRVLNIAGEYEYICEQHTPSMKGTITVK